MTTARDQLYFDIFVTALEGGIGYWSETESYHWMRKRTSISITDTPEDIHGFYADIIEADGDVLHRITVETIANGYQLATGAWANKLHWSSGEEPPWMVTADTDWDFDAGDADMIVQLGLFGDVRYG